jgi:hypothetical protein
MLEQKRSVSLTFMRTPVGVSRTPAGTAVGASIHISAMEKCKKRLRHKGFLQCDATRNFRLQLGAKSNLFDRHPNALMELRLR